MRALHVLFLGAAFLACGSALSAEDPPVPGAPPTDPAMEAAREAKLKELRRDLRKWAQGPYADNHKDDILKSLDALHTIGGLDAAKAALEVLPITDADVRDKAFALLEKVHDKELVAPLGALIEHKDLRRDWDLHNRIAHALTVTAHVSAIEPLTGLIASEDAKVVAQAADGLATFGEAKVDEKREAVQRLIDLYESTWNLMQSVRPEDQKAAKVAYAKWEVYGAPVRKSLQALTAQQLSKPKDWRRWWNDHKKDAKWVAGTTPAEPGSPSKPR
jgi:hypothetical protein